ncbi:MAG: KamA family radical SAM protein [Planctomycetes bacterium]|nr:KamA family radical SAM protein [Planctomycetota bacterium]
MSKGSGGEDNEFGTREAAEPPDLRRKTKTPQSRPKATLARNKSRAKTAIIAEFPSTSHTALLVQGSSVSASEAALTISTSSNQDGSDKISPLALAFKKRFFPDASLESWNNWTWQLRNRIKHSSQLERYFDLTDDERNFFAGGSTGFPLGITPYYASLIFGKDAQDPLRRTMIPTALELTKGVGESDDPLGEDHTSPVASIVHRYPDRVLFLSTDFCSVYCRYCTRSRFVGGGQKRTFNRAVLDQGIEYVAQHPEIRDVLLSGGDPLTLGDSQIEYLLSRLRAIKHVEFLRIGTKVPVVLPQRIKKPLVRMLRKYHPFYMSVHFTHPDELTPEVSTACNMLADAGIPLGSQTVLLKGVNDNVDAMKKLMHGLLMIRVRPYYLYQCDPITGSEHFRTSVETGLEIIKGLRGHTTGYAVPHYVIDAPGGGGKIPILPNYMAGRDEENVYVTNYENKMYAYPDPKPGTADVPVRSSDTAPAAVQHALGAPKCSFTFGA